MQKGPGAFLVRFSQSTADYAGAFTVTRINEKGATVNIRINQDKTGGFSVNRDSTYPDLEVLIQDLKDTLFLKHACKVHDTHRTHIAHDTTHAHMCVCACACAVGKTQGSRFQRIFEGAHDDDFSGYEVLTEAEDTSRGKGRQ